MYDPISARYFAALVPPGDPSADPSLVSWSDDDRSPSLDAAVDSAAAARLPDGLAALVPAQSGRGGVLAVDASGAVRWFGADARKIAASRRESESADAAGEEDDDDQTRRAKKGRGGGRARAAASTSPRAVVVESASRVAGGGGVLVVTRSGGGRGGSDGVERRAVLHLAAGDERESGASVTPAWSVALAAAPGRERGDVTDPNARVVAASATADELVVLWSNAVWAAYDPTETKKADEAKEQDDDEAKEGDDEATTTPRTVSPRRTCSLAPDDAGDGGGAGNKKKRAAGAVASGGSASETRSSETSLAAVRLPAASATSLGGGHHLVARVGVGGARGALVATLDSKYGAVHGAMDASSSSEGEGADGSGLRGRVDGGVRVEALVGSGGSSAAAAGPLSSASAVFGGAPAQRALVCVDGEALVCDLPPVGPVTLASAFGALSVDTDRGAAAALAMGREGVARAAAPPFGGAVAVPRLPEIPPDARGDVIEFEAFDPGSFDPDRSAVEALDAARAAFESATLEPGGSKKSGAATTQPLKKSGGAKRAAAVTAALEPYLRRTETAPREFVSAAIAACVLESLWDPVLALIDAGLVPDSTVAGGLVSAAAEANRLDVAKRFLVRANRVGADDVALCLDAFLGPDGVPEAPASALRAEARESAEAAVREAEAAARAAKAAAAKPRGGGEKASPGDALRAARSERTRRLASARVAVAAVEAFSAEAFPAAPLLHALVSKPMDAVGFAEALGGASAANAAAFARFLTAWLEAYADRDLDPIAPAPVGLPSLSAVVEWTSALIDAQFTAFAMGGEAKGGGSGASDDVHEATRRAAAALERACAAAGRTAGALAHVAEGGPVPEDQGVKSATYSIEVVDW